MTGQTPVRRFRIEDDLWERLTASAKAEGATPSGVIRRLIITHLTLETAMDLDTARSDLLRRAQLGGVAIPDGLVDQAARAYAAAHAASLAGDGRQLAGDYHHNAAIRAAGRAIGMPAVTDLG